MVDQSHLGVVTVTGPDRLTWLNSITSQELTDAGPAHVDRAAGAQPAGARRARGGRRRRRRDHLAAHRDADRAGRLAEPDEVHAPGRDRGRDRRLGGHRRARRRRGHRGRAGHLARPVADHRASAARGTGRPTTSTPAPTATGGSCWCRATGWSRRCARGRPPAGRSSARGPARPLRVEAWRPRASHEVDHRTIPHELDWLRTAVHLTQGLLPRAGDGRARAQPRPAAAPPRDAAPRRVRAPAARARCRGARRGEDGQLAGARAGGRAGDHRRAAPRARARSRSPW